MFTPQWRTTQVCIMVHISRGISTLVSVFVSFRRSERKGSRFTSIVHCFPELSFASCNAARACSTALSASTSMLPSKRSFRLNGSASSCRRQDSACGDDTCSGCAKYSLVRRILSSCSFVSMFTRQMAICSALWSLSNGSASGARGMGIGGEGGGAGGGGDDDGSDGCG